MIRRVARHGQRCREHSSSWLPPQPRRQLPPHVFHQVLQLSQVGLFHLGLAHALAAVAGRLVGLPAPVAGDPLPIRRDRTGRAAALYGAGTPHQPEHGLPSIISAGGNQCQGTRSHPVIGEHSSLPWNVPVQRPPYPCATLASARANRWCFLSRLRRRLTRCSCAGSFSARAMRAGRVSRSPCAWRRTFSSDRLAHGGGRPQEIALRMAAISTR